MSVGARVWRRLRDAGDIFRHHAHFDGSERRVQFDVAGRRVGEGPERVDASAARAHQHHLRRQLWMALAGRRLRLDPFDDLRVRLRERQFSFDRRSVGRRNVAAEERDLGIVRRRTRLQGHVALFGRGVRDLERIERGNGVRESGRRRREGRRKQRERSRPENFLVADLDRRRRLERVLRRYDVDRADQTIAFARVHAFALRGFLAGGRREFRRLGKIRFAIEAEVERGAYQRESAEARERDAEHPA